MNLPIFRLNSIAFSQNYLFNSMRAFTFLSLFLLFTGFVHSQTRIFPNSDYAYIYKLSNEQADEIYRKGKPKKAFANYLSQRIDSVPYYQKDYIQLPDGHYLFELVKESKVYYFLYSYSDLQVVLLDNSRYLTFGIYEKKSGKEITDAKALLDGKEIPYDHSLHCYRLPQRANPGYLKIEYNQVIHFRKLDFETEKYRQDSRDRKFNGYVQFSQPLYRPGDTLWMKALLLKRGHREYTKPMKLTIRDRSWKTIRETEINPKRPGVYEYTTALNDSFPPDQKYGVMLKHGRKRLGAEFLMEDYLLDEVTWLVSTDKERYETGEDILLKLAGKDQNGQFIADGEVEYTIEPNSIAELYTDSIQVPFSFSSGKVKLKFTEFTFLNLPDSLFPFAKVLYKIELKFRNSNNEQSVKTIMISKSRKRNHLVVSKEMGAFIFDYYEGSQLKSAEGTLIQFQGEKELSQTKVRFPYRYTPNVLADKYKLIAPNDLLVRNIAAEQEEIYCENLVTSDSVFFRLINPERLTVYFQIFKNKKLLKEGSDSTLIFSDSKKLDDKYSLVYSYLKNGKEKAKEECFFSDPSELQVSLNQEEQISPGATSTIEIKVHDAEGNPVQGADLTGLSINAQFPSRNFQGLDFSRNHAWAAGKRRTYLLSSSSANGRFKELDSSYYNRFRLDQVLFYQITQPKSGINQIYEPLKDGESGQVVPLIYENGKDQFVYYIEADEMPIYVYGLKNTNITPPNYSFELKPGYHRLKIKTENKTIEIDSVLIKDGFQLVLSLNSAIKQANVRVKKSPTRLTKPEWEKLLPKMVFVKNSAGKTVYVGTRGQMTCLQSYASDFVGPMQSDTAFYIGDNQLLAKWKYSSNVTTELTKQRILESVPKKKSILSRRFHRGASSEYLLQKSWPTALTARQLLAPPPKERTKWIGSEISNPAKGSFYLRILDSMRVQFIGLHGPERFTAPNNNQPWYNLTAGIYSLELMHEDGTFSSGDTIEIQPSSMLLMELKEIKPCVNPKMKSELNAAALQFLQKRVKDTEVFPKGNKGMYYSYDYSWTNNPSEFRTIPYRYYGFAKRNKYYMIGGVLNSGFASSASSLISKPGPGLDLELSYRLNPRVTFLMNPGALYLANDESFHSTQVHANFLFHVDAFQHRSRYQKRPDWVPYFIGGISNRLYFSSDQGDKKTLADAAFPLGLGLRYKLSKQLNIAPELTVNTFSLRKPSFSLGAPENGIPSYTQIGFRAQYIIPQKVICPRFNGGNRFAVGKRSEDDEQGRYRSSFYLPMPSLNFKQKQIVTIIQNPNRASESDNSLDENFTDSTSNIPSPSEPELRENFKDLAYWQPDLITDENGKASFTVTFPDNITSWDSYLLAVKARKWQSGSTRMQTKAYKSFLASLFAPRFLLEGDSADLVCKLVNYKQDTLSCKTYFAFKGDTTRANVLLTEGNTSTYRIHAPADDSITVTYMGEIAGAKDGERRSIPVFKTGSIETIGKFLFINKDTSFTWSFPKDHNHHLYIRSNPLDVMLDEIRYLKDYPHECMEQTASRLQALLMEKKISAALGRPFRHELQVRQMLRRLSKHQNPDGGWGWWPENPSTPYFTSYISNVLLEAQKARYDCGKELNDAKSFLVNRLLFTPLENEKSQLHYYATLTQLPMSSSARVMLDSMIAKLGRSISEDQWLTYQRLQQLSGKAVKREEILARRNQTYLGGVYWGNENSYSLHYNKTSESLIAYSILRTLDSNDVYLDSIQNYFMEIRNNGHWQNTVESASILSTLLPDMLKEKYKTPQVKLSGSIQKDKISFPMEATIPDSGSVKMEVKTSTPVYLSTWYKKQDANPKERSDNFEITTSFVDEKNNALSALTAGKTVTMRVEVTAKKYGDYIMIEVPIPAGCTHGDNVKGPYPEIYRQRFKDKVCIFYNYMNPGKYTIELPLEVRYKGRYTMNPARAELMYFPIFNGNNALRKVSIR
jgi:hypothetical protein